MALIPSGEFSMGSNHGRADERPVHNVRLDAFYMDVFEITNKQFAKFLSQRGNNGSNGETFINLELARIKLLMAIGRWIADLKIIQ